MNVLTGRLLREQGLRLVLADGQRIVLPDDGVSDAWLGRDVHLGVRPEHLVRADAGDPAAFLPMVEVVEAVGSEVFVNLRLGDVALVARLPPGDLPAPDAAMAIRIAAPRLHLFDVQSGERLESAA